MKNEFEILDLSFPINDICHYGARTFHYNLNLKKLVLQVVETRVFLRLGLRRALLILSRITKTSWIFITVYFQLSCLQSDYDSCFEKKVLQDLEQYQINKTQKLQERKDRIAQFDKRRKVLAKS